METFKVVGVGPVGGCSVCKDENGVTRRIDFVVDGTLPKGTSNKDLVGKTVVCDYTYPYLEIASRPKIQETKNEK